MTRQIHHVIQRLHMHPIRSVQLRVLTELRFYVGASSSPWANLRIRTSYTSCSLQVLPAKKRALINA